MRRRRTHTDVYLACRRSHLLRHWGESSQVKCVRPFVFISQACLLSRFREEHLIV